MIVYKIKGFHNKLMTYYGNLTFRLAFILRTLCRPLFPFNNTAVFNHPLLSYYDFVKKNLNNTLLLYEPNGIMMSVHD